MRRFGSCLTALFLTAGAGSAPQPASAQDTGGQVVQFGSDYTLAAGQSVDELVVFGASATIRGEVDGDAVVIGGSAELAGTGSVEGDFVVIGGGATIASGASVDGDLVVIGGTVEAPAGFAPGGELVSMGAGPAAAAVPFVTRGLLAGRVIVPDLSWMWVAIAVLLAVFLALNFAFDRPVRACVEGFTARPLTTFLVGLAVVVLAGPVTVLLAISILGLVAVPFLWAALAAAVVIGGVAVSRWLGEKILPSPATESRGHQALAVLVGFTLTSLALMVPILGGVTFATLGVLALGGASTAVARGLRREHPVPDPASGPAGDVPPPPTEHEAEVPPPPASEAPSAADLALLPRATFLARTGAFLLDLVLVSLIFFGLLDLDSGQWFFALLIVYHIGLWSWKGTTVGGVIARLRVVRTDGHPLAATDALVRGLSSIFSAVVLGIGFFWILKEPERESWHDKIAGTCVVSVPKSWPRT
ncbi:MAG: RDD family protein [Gammaproteobacteria bacterium]|nr:RDD family protein [Gammaproteobacteria bacterium]MDE0247881.1 RDD family protein [Gammaproteobacteria bacterium]